MFTRFFCVVFTIFLISISVIGFAQAPDDPEVENVKPQTEKTNQEADLEPPAIQPVIQEQAPDQTSEKEEAGDKIDKTNEADLTQQTRMADAEEEIVKLTRRQLYATYGSILLTILAVGAAVWAAWAATCAARSAQASVSVASDTAKKQLRAYLAVNKCLFETPPKEKNFAIKVLIGNSGNTPAFNVRVRVIIFYGPFPLSEEMPDLPPESEYKVPVGAGQPITIIRDIFCSDPDAVLEGVKAKKMGIWIQGTILYDDCFGDEQFLKIKYIYGAHSANTGIDALTPEKDGNDAS